MLQYLIDKEMWLKYRNNMTYPQDNKIYQCYLQKEKVIHRRKGEILMKNEVQVFQNEEFGEVRTTEVNGEIWFVAKDVAGALGYANQNEAVQDHVDIEDKLNSKTLPSFDLNLGQRGGWLINESGLYSLILYSRKRLNFAIRKLASLQNKSFGIVWNDFYRELSYRWGIDLKKRGGSPYIKHIQEKEWQYVLRTLTALCEDANTTLSEIMKNIRNDFKEEE
jgi:hypothetical protein